jgi:RHS repeat-associated protein
MANVNGAVSRTYSYDAAGNVIADGATTYTYNDASRMRSATRVGTTTYMYNALGQRVKKSNASSTHYFVYDEAGRLVGEYDTSGALIQETIWFEDIPVATIRPNGSGGISLFYIHTDHLNTPRRISRPSDNIVVWRWDSDPFGATPANDDPDGDGNSFVYNLRFPGQYYDAETGLSYNYFRDYDPATGGYVQSDPIGLEGGINTYAYALSNPISNIDPDGLQTPALCANPANAEACAAAGVDTAASRAAARAAVEAARKLLDPERTKGYWTCNARADCNDNIPGNCPEDPLKRFAFGKGVAKNQGDARNMAKSNATHTLACQPKHVSCKCTGPKGEKYSGGC